MFQGLYLKLLFSKDAKIKWFSTLTTGIVITPDETYGIYIDFDNDLEWDIYVYNMSVRKASYWDFMFIVTVMNDSFLFGIQILFHSLIEY